FNIPIKIKMFEEKFLVQIINANKDYQSDELMLDANNTVEFEKFYDCIFVPMKRDLERRTRFLHFTTDDFLRWTEPENKEPDDDSTQWPLPSRVGSVWPRL